MKTILVLAQHTGLAAALRAVVDPERFRVLPQELDSALSGLSWTTNVDACVIDADLTDIRPIRVIENLRRRLPLCPILLYASAKQWEWEEEAYLLGVEHVLTKPVRGRLFNSLLDRLWPAEPPPARPPVAAPPAAPEPKPAESLPAPARSLEAYRNFSRILTNSLDCGTLLTDFLQLLREIINVNRAAIFLRQPGESLSGTAGAGENRALHSACAIGLNSERLNHLGLSLDSGIGGFVHRKGRILRRDSADALADPLTTKEFDLLGVQVAIPVLDGESLVGVALLDNRLTGEPLSNEELALIFHLLSEFGLAIKNSWLHDRLSASHEIMSDLLNQLGSGCVVVGRNLSVFHANQSSLKFFPHRRGDPGGLAFSDLPQPIGSKVFEALQTGVGLAPFKYRPPESPESVYLITVAPFKQQNSATVNAVLLLLDDCTQVERTQQLEIETSNLRLVKAMAEGLAHEIGNCLVPLSTHQQLLSHKYDDPEFRASLAGAMADGVRRISRLSNQMLYLTRDVVGRTEAMVMTPLVEEAFREAQNSQNEKNALLLYENGGRPYLLSGNRAGLKHALTEVILNALQANPPDPQVQVRLNSETDAQGAGWLRIDIKDAGKGFSPETAKKALDPFFSTRNVGLGLGLTVTRKIIETHGGRIEIAPAGQPNSVVIYLPLEKQPAEPAADPKPRTRRENPKTI